MDSLLSSGYDANRLLIIVPKIYQAMNAPKIMPNM